MPDSEVNLKFILLAGTIMVLVLGAIIMVFLYLHQRRHMAFYLEKKTMEAAFANEVVQARLDQHEETLTRLGQDLHDQMSQMVATMMVDLARLEGLLNDNNCSTELVEIAKNDLYNLHQSARVISKSMSATILENFDLIDSLKELELISNKPGHTPIRIQLNGQVRKLSQQIELVLYRMIQETIGNALRYSKANQIDILVNYENLEMHIQVSDNGIGFDTNMIKTTPKSGTGLNRLSKRATNIGALLHIKSKPDFGTEVRISLPYLNMAKETIDS